MLELGTIIFLCVVGILAIISQMEFYNDTPKAGRVKENEKALAQLATLSSAIATLKDTLLTDVSKWQGVIDFVRMRDMGVKGTVIKCGQGAGLDPKFVNNWNMAKSAKLKRGTYWFYDSRVEPRVQAQLWADAIKDDLGELPHFLDFEENYGGAYKGLYFATLCLAEFQRLTGLPDERIGIYTGYYYWLEYGSTNKMYRRYWLWLAWYGREENVTVPLPWTQIELLFWQFTEQGDGLNMGVQSRELDLNYFVKGQDVYEMMFGEVYDIPPQTGESGMKLIWSSQYRMSLRNAPAITGTKIGEAQDVGTKFLVDQIVPPTSGGIVSDRWAHVIEINGQKQPDGTDYDLWVAVVHLGVVYCDHIEDVTDPTPEPTTNPTANIEFIDREGNVFVGTVELKPK